MLDTTQAGARDRVGELEEAIQARTPTNGEAFRMTLGETTYAERARAGDQLRKELQRLCTEQREAGERHERLGQFAGMPLEGWARRDAGGTYVVGFGPEGVDDAHRVVNGTDLTSTGSTGLVVRLENGFDKLEQVRDEQQAKLNVSKMSCAEQTSRSAPPLPSARRSRRRAWKRDESSGRSISWRRIRKAPRKRSRLRKARRLQAAPPAPKTRRRHQLPRPQAARSEAVTRSTWTAARLPRATSRRCAPQARRHLLRFLKKHPGPSPRGRCCLRELGWGN